MTFNRTTPAVALASSDLPLGVNLKASLLPNWIAVRSAVKAGTGSGKVVLIGDRTTAGYGAAGTAGSYTNTQQVAPPAQLRRLLNAHGIPADAANLMSDSNVNTQNGVAINTYDPRVAPASWTLPANNGLCGGSLNTSGATVFAFTPVTAFDTIDVFYGTTGGGGTFTVDVDGGASLGTINCNAAGDLKVQTLTCALGTHTINVTRASGTAYLFGICCRNSTVSRVYVQQCAHAGGGASTFATSFSPFGYSNIVADLDADLTIINLGINDWIAGTSQSTFSTNLQTIITNAKTTGDVILCTPFPSSTATSMATQSGLVDVINSLAASNSVPLIDNFAIEGSYAAGNAAAHYSDANHPNGLGYSLYANRIADVLAYV
jgi:lysophospholipase L1-like esterase